MADSTLTETETRRTYQRGAMSVADKETVDPGTCATLRHVQITRGMMDDSIELEEPEARDLLACLQDALGESKSDAKRALDGSREWHVGSLPTAIHDSDGNLILDNLDEEIAQEIVDDHNARLQPAAEPVEAKAEGSVTVRRNYCPDLTVRLDGPGHMKVLNFIVDNFLSGLRAESTP
jgi:hypothetical protein